MYAICLEAMLGTPPESLLMISSANWCANFRTCASVGAPRYTLPTTAWEDGLRTSYIQPEMLTSAEDSVRLPNATKFAFSGWSVQVRLRSSDGCESVCCG